MTPFIIMSSLISNKNYIWIPMRALPFVLQNI